MACTVSPTDFTGLRVWLAADTLTVGEGNLVPTWTEAGAVEGASDDFDQPDAGDQGRWYGGIVCDEQPVVRMDGRGRGYISSRFIYNTAAPDNLNVYAGTGLTVFSLMRIATAATTACGLDFPEQSGSFNATLAVNPARVEVSVVGTDSLQHTVTLPYTVGEFALVESWFDGSTLSAVVGGAELQTVASPGLLSGAGQFRIQTAGGATDVLEAVELTAYRGVLSASDRAALRTRYFGCKYGCLGLGGATGRFFIW